MSRASSLYRLQETDLELDACRARLAEIETALSGSPAVQAARTRAQAAEAQLAKARAVLQDLELENAALDEKIREVEGRLYGGRVRNPKELQDLQADAESLKRRRAASEEQQLNALILFEETETQLAQAQADLRRAEEDAVRSNAALNAERAALTVRLTKLEAEREALGISIPTTDRQLYDRLRQHKHGRALSRLKDGVCTACGIEPSAALRQEAKRGELARCSGCDRILYME